MWPKTLIRKLNGACFTAIANSEEHEKALNKKGYFRIKETKSTSKAKSKKG